ncbi:hypothetical protein ASF13_19345 [Erwinia sp. Leaf53]|nr:hypothetical protein ASF13_19345 [Erwinia sp. Leaf53]
MVFHPILFLVKICILQLKRFQLVIKLHMSLKRRLGTLITTHLLKNLSVISILVFFMLMKPGFVRILAEPAVKG